MIALAVVVALVAWLLGRAAGRFVRAIGEEASAPSAPPWARLAFRPPEPLTAFLPRTARPAPPRELPPPPDAPCWTCGRPLVEGNHDHDV